MGTAAAARLGCGEGSLPVMPEPHLPFSRARGEGEGEGGRTEDRGARRYGKSCDELLNCTMAAGHASVQGWHRGVGLGVGGWEWGVLQWAD